MIQGRIQPTSCSARATSAILALFERRTGQRIAATRAWRLEATLQPIIRDLSLASLDALASRVAAGTDHHLCDRIVAALLNHETSFFRDAAVLDQAADALAAMRNMAGARRIRVWSAGCSTGQEPLSLAMLCDERGIEPGSVEIVATDLSADAVARARSATYTQFEIQRGLSVRRMMAWFDGDESGWRARPALVDRVRFRQHNLVGDPPPAGSFDLILCRNVLMYFTPERRRDVFEHLARAVRPGGLLVLGAGETVIGQTDRFEASRDWRGFYNLADPAR